MNQIEANNMRSDAYDRLKYQILHGKFTPGQKISEKMLTERLGIGRTPVREAIIRLERYELVEVIPQSGTYVTKINLKSAENAQFLRRKIDSDILLQFAMKADDKLVKRLEQNLDMQRKAVKDRNANEFFDLDEKFHQLFYIGAQREEIWNWLQTINMHLNRYRWLRLSVAELNWETLMDQHEAIYDAVSRQDVEAIRFSISSHLRLMLAEISSLTSEYPDYFEVM